MTTHPADAPLEQERSTTLHTLVSGLMQMHGLGLRAVAAKTTMSHATIDNLTNGRHVRVPHAWQLSEIAVALGVAPSVLHHAAAKDYGLDVGPDTEAIEGGRELMASFAKMHPRGRADLVRMAAVMADPIAALG